MSCYRYPIPVSKANIASIAKFVLSHEVGHILDPDVYASKEELPRVLGGLGIAIVSTNKGVMTDKEARKENVGGEVLAFVW